LSDLGDRAGAKLAYLRSVELGSTNALVNLGLMLAEDGAGDEALPHLQRAADAGVAAGFWGIGKIHEERSEWSTAANAYRSGARLGDPACSFRLGIVLFELHDRIGAKAAFLEAHDRGHKHAAELLAALEREDDPGPVEAGPTVDQLWCEATTGYGAVATQRYELGCQWIAGTLKIEEHQARLVALRQAEKEITEFIERNSRDFPVQPEPRTSATMMSTNDWLVPASPNRSSPSGVARPRFELGPAYDEAFTSEANEAVWELRRSKEKLLGGGHRRNALTAWGRVLARLEALRALIAAETQQVCEAEQARDAGARAAADRAHASLDPITSRAARASLELPPVLQPWSSPRWRSWTIEDASSLGVRGVLGGMLAPTEDPHLGTNARFGTDLRIPWLVAWGQNLVLAGWARSLAHAFVRSMLLRELVVVPPGKVRFCIVDPVGLGQSAGELLDLAEYDPDLISGKVWSQPQDLEARLGELSAHIELVIQKYLRTTYATIDDFNDAAGAIAEPYKVLVLFDFPTGLSAESANILKRIVQNGPRCGIFTVIVWNMSVQPAYGVDTDAFRNTTWCVGPELGFVDNVNGYRLEVRLEPEVLPEGSDVARRIINGVGRASRLRTESAVTFEKVFSMFSEMAGRGLRPELGTASAEVAVSDPDTWWKVNSSRGVFAPIGQKGARDVAVLGFDSGDHSGALLVGRPGSGKSTLLHALVGGLTCLYGPDELELYLIDFREGVEFKAYAEEKLPHARVIAIESDREFGLSVLESLQGEMTRRGELLRGTGGHQAGLQGFREATGQKVPRILLVFDEFQVLLARNDKTGLAAADLLESIIRQGRGFGVHVLLASQSVAGLDALGGHVLQLLPVRILLPAAEADARKVLGDRNNAGDFLISHGDGILNAAGGAVEANERFKGALMSEADRIARLQVMHKKASDCGFTRVPMVFEGNSLVPLHSQDVRRFCEELRTTGSTPLRMRTGEPMTVGEVGDLILSREAGANVLAILRNGENDRPSADVATGPAYGLLSAAVASAILGDACVDVIDFMGSDDGLDILFEELLDIGRMTLKRRRAFPDVLTEYAEEVARRVEQDDYKRPAKVLVLFGVHRARDLDSGLGNPDVDAVLVEKLEQVMRDGPEVGVHAWLWCDTVAGASRRLSSGVMREVGWRIAGKMSGDDSRSFIGNAKAAELRDSQVVMVNEDRNIDTRMTAYAPPEREWLREVVAAMPIA